METFTIEPQGPFSLQEAAMFGFGQRHDTVFDGTMRLAFCVDGYAAQAGVAVTQASDGTVHGAITATRGDPDPVTVAGQVARVLSLDKDARGYHAVGRRDPVVARLLVEAPGLRPPLFYSPYEAAFWSVLSARRNHRTAQTWRRRLASAAGEGFDVAGTRLWALPTPAQILRLGAAGLSEVAGFEPLRAERLCGVAHAALRGTLHAAELAHADPGDARRRLRLIPGIGPFYADLVLIRSTGVTDIFPAGEPRLQALLGDFYDLGAPATPEQAQQLSEGWSPWRTWIAVLVRSAGPRLTAAA